MKRIVIIFISIIVIYLFIGYATPMCYVKDNIIYLFNSISSSASIVGFIITFLVYKKIQLISSPAEKIEQMKKAMKTNNKYYDVGLNMEIDLSSPPSDKIKEIINKFEEYNNCIKEVVLSNNTKAIWESKHIGIPNRRNQIKLLLLALEIQIMQLEVANSNIPISSAIKLIDEKCDEFINIANNTGYVD